MIPLTYNLCCPHCGDKIAVDCHPMVTYTNAHVFDFGPHAGTTETEYDIQGWTQCPVCGEQIFVHGMVFEHPAGSLEDDVIRAEATRPDWMAAL